MRAKKGVVFEGVIFIVILVVLVTAFTTLYKKHGQFPDGYRIGDRQFSLMGSIQEVEAGLFYADQSEQHSVDGSIYEFAQNGGIPESNFFDEEGFIGIACGRYNGANAWYEIKRTNEGYETTDCFDETKVDE